ncbi:hypothetical protein HEP73_03871 [Xanthomonas sp. GW]|uniref:hypothetical protein n=1 Tax=Xanthomonas sp. GW TaxID=2724121 RepID=UPI00186260B4|nr:hypothetical protein [Xanthomonas sp. GW]QNH22922.1 hypothetical protein HEP73_03871 [Xanthomonas sp. GW]
MIGSGNYGLRLLGVLFFAATVLTAACSSAASAAKVPPFAGKWGYAKKCDLGHYLGLDLQQSGDRVSGDWSEGTNARGSDGRLEGRVRGNKLYVRYCSDDGEVGYAVCPEYSGAEDYFLIEQETLVRYQKYGSSYRRGVALHPDRPGKEVPFDKDCMDMEDSP